MAHVPTNTENNDLAVPNSATAADPFLKRIQNRSHPKLTQVGTSAHFSGRWQRIKHYMSVALPTGELNASRQAKREEAVWPRRFWEHRLRDQDDWRRHMDYGHYNRWKHGYVARPAEWPFRSFDCCARSARAAYASILALIRASGLAEQGRPPRIESLEEAERAHILKALEMVGWRVSGTGGAAECLGLKPSTLEFRMKKLGITRPA